MLSSRIFPLSVNTRLSSYYGLFFLAIGSFAPFTAVWFDSLNISPSMSGAIFAAPSIATVIFTIFIGGWADRLQDWRTAIIICNWIVLVGLCWLIFRQGPWDLLLVWTVCGLFTRASGPIIDAAALNSTQKTNSDYGRIRSFGSMGFIVGISLAGWLFNYVGIEWYVAVLLLSGVARVAGAHLLPPFKAGVRSNKLPATRLSGLVVLRQPGILLVLVGSAFVTASHAFNNIFSVMHWNNLGISTGMSSLMWTVGVLAEVALMWSFKSVAKNFSARKCLLVAGTICTARWFLAGTDPGLAQLFLLQALHSITFGLTLLATINFIARRVHEDHAAQAQSVYTVIMTLLTALGAWMSGILYGQFAGLSYWAMAMMALVGTAIVAWSFRSDLDDSALSE